MARVFPEFKRETPFLPTIGGNVIKRVEQESYWETDIQIVECGANTNPVDVVMGPIARGKINYLMAKFPKMEWLAYLTGTKDNWFIEDIVIPKQVVTTVSVHVDKQGVNSEIIGVIHSHHDMGHNFSGTDDKYINQNHDISLCISHSGIDGHVRQKTECGRFTLRPVKVIENIEGLDFNSFDKEIEDNIKVKSVTIRSRFDIHSDEIDQAISNYKNYDFFDEEPSLKEKSLMDRNVLGEVGSYRDDIKDVDIDAYYLVEFKSLVDLIDSIGKPSYDICEENAFNSVDNLYTDGYYKLIEEISCYNDDFTEHEMKSLRLLASELRSKINQYN